MHEFIQWQRIQRCSNDEKKKLLPFIRQLILLGEQVREGGTPELDEFIMDTDDPFIKKALSKVVSGYEPELLAEILYTTLLSTDVSDIQYLKYIIFIRFTLSVQNENLPTRQLKAVLESYLGLGFIDSL